MSRNNISKILIKLAILTSCIFSDHAIAADYLNFKFCSSFDRKSEEVRLLKEGYKLKLEKGGDKRYVTYWVGFYTIFDGGVFNLRVSVFDGKIYKVNLWDIDTSYYSSQKEYFSRMQKKYGDPKFFSKSQNESMIDVWDGVFHYQVNDLEVDIVVGESTLKAITDLYGFRFSGLVGHDTYIEYVCKDLHKVYEEYKKNNESKNKKTEIKF
jgi:hypothetical protein